MTTLETLLDLAKTDEGLLRIRVMVAELAGYHPETRQNEDSHGLRVGSTTRWRKVGDDRLFWYLPIKPPDYTGSLDAMAEVEETLTDDEWENFCDILLWAASESHSNYTACRIGLSATALQRAIAFILTKQSA